MAGDNKIYIVYDPLIENSGSLNKFLGTVLGSAKYPIDLIETITLENYLKLIDTDGVKNYTICLNKTYSSVTIEYSRILGFPAFKFFSRFYQNRETSTQLLGLILDIDTIFSDEASKRNVWEKVKTFINFYTDTNKNFSIPKESIKVESKPETINEKEIKQVSEVVIQNEVKPNEILIDEIVECTPSYQELLDFYNAFKHVKKLYSSITEKLDE